MSGNRAGPRWGSIVPGLFMVGMGLLILASVAGIVPTAPDAYFGPPWIVTAVAVGLVLGGTLVWVPVSAPVWLRSILFLGAFLLIALVCNWSAFSPTVRYQSSGTIGPVSFSGEDPVGGRIVFGLVALVIDAILAGGLVMWVRDRIHR